ncbi:protein kinase domain-containing protein [Nocardia blacklockiae]|uniref:protein kinase domain-containing protein n=1 Tax=Nocardia blacklockiae TaxID=480036 RepID=UPI002B4AFA95|nr:protein kinase [Nocardia blacklockiae]
MPLSWVASVAAQVATVLSPAHALPVVHRDLKPANILLTCDGSVKAIDFGIAAILDRNVRRITHAGQAIGTFRYMSPEAVVHGLRLKQPQDRPADAYTVYGRLLPFLPAPGAETTVDAHLPGLPDPTRIFRRPNAPLESPCPEAVGGGRIVSGPVGVWPNGVADRTPPACPAIFSWSWYW